MLRHSYAVSGSQGQGHSQSQLFTLSDDQNAGLLSRYHERRDALRLELQVQAVFEMIPAPRAGSEAQQSRRRLVGFARCECPAALPRVAVPLEEQIACKLHWRYLPADEPMCGAAAGLYQTAFLRLWCVT